MELYMFAAEVCMCIIPRVLCYWSFSYYTTDDLVGGNIQCDVSLDNDGICDAGKKKTLQTFLEIKSLSENWSSANFA